LKRRGGSEALASPHEESGYHDSMPVTAEVVFKLVFCLLAIGTIVFAHRYARSPELRAAEDKAGGLLKLMAVIAAMVYVNLGGFHTSGSFVHHWEHFHYFLGSKYFAELGYDGIYLASLEAESITHPDRPKPRTVRDLRNNQIMPLSAMEDRMTEVRARFSPERWQGFVEDNAYWLDENKPGFTYLVRNDHGFNPPPTWVFAAQLFSHRLPANKAAWTLTGSLDLALLALMFVMVFRTFGSRIGCLSLIIFGLGYPWRYYWVGGAFLREDWLVATVIAVCMVKRERYMTAGALVAYATMVRLFPVLFLFGLGVCALRCLIKREPVLWAFKVAGGFVLCVALCVGAGTLAGRGAKVWPEFYENITVHHESLLTNNVGLSNLLLYDTDILTRRYVDRRLPDPWTVVQAKIDERRSERITG
jgi:hypothetical protein